MESFKIALAGNPNTGKSTLFNILTGLHQKTGNFTGVTVEKAIGKLQKNTRIEIIDLPGTYTLFPKSLDEDVAYNVLSNPNDENFPDYVLVVTEAINLKRNLLLCSQIIDLGLPCALAINYIDESKKNGITIDSQLLSKELGIPVYLISARTKEGISELIEGFLTKNFKVSSFIGDKANYLEDLKKVYDTQSELKEIKYKKNKEFDAGEYQRKDIVKRSSKIKDITKHCITYEERVQLVNKQRKLDYITTHPIWGYAVFFFILFIIFQAIFNLASYPQEAIEVLFSKINAQLEMLLPAGVFVDLLTNGIINGIGGVMVFVPQIALLFFFIGLLEETGYLARVTFLTDKIMRNFGLSGKSIIPLLGGTACAVPAILATRNIENRKTRLITILVTPLMSCSARLPIYILFIGFLIPKSDRVLGILSKQGIALFLLYLIGFVAALLGAIVFSRFVKNKGRNSFAFELPIYRTPYIPNVFNAMYFKVLDFIKGAGGIIVAIAIILWFLASYGNTNPNKTFSISKTEKIEESFAGNFGKAIEPAILPLGYDWKIGIAIISSFAAREVFVGTLATIYGVDDEEVSIATLKEKMSKETFSNSNKLVYTKATVISLLVFYIFAMMCMSTIAVVYKETQSVFLTVAQFFVMTGFAYFFALLAYNLFK